MDDNVTSLDAHKIAVLIVEHWSDAYSDNGALWARSKKSLEVVHQSVSAEVWDEALKLAHYRWGQQ
jgi:hypothetical protein